jgi:acetoin utilization protein AcuB
MKRIADLMTRQPWTVQIDDSLAVARRMIAERDIHHLPVLESGEVVGMVTERELAHAAGRIGTVSDAMTPVRCVAPETPLDEVLELMATEHRDAIVITSNGAVEGIFTSSDAVRVLLELVRRRARRAA